jgi:hypothetical protein
MSVSSVMLSLSWKCKLEAIDPVRQAHVAALNSGDVDAWAALFSEDGVQMPVPSIYPVRLVNVDFRSA